MRQPQKTLSGYDKLGQPLHYSEKEYGSMKSVRNIFRRMVFCNLLCCLAFIGCNAEEGDSALHHQSLIEHLNESDSANINGGLSSRPHLETGKQVFVEGLETDQLTYVETRIDNITQYPCSECHDRPLQEIQTGNKPAPKKAHWQIESAHAPAAIMNCFTCHNSRKMNTLRNLTGGEISFDHSYQVCAQCHSPQWKDWIGGAHGKRLGGWAPPRVIQSCIDCHDPHQPAWEKRWPKQTRQER